MLRFSQSNDPTSHRHGSGRERMGQPARKFPQQASSLSGRLRLPLLLIALLLVLAARAKLEQPETHQAIGQILESPQLADPVSADPVSTDLVSANPVSASSAQQQPTEALAIGPTNDSSSKPIVPGESMADESAGDEKSRFNEPAFSPKLLGTIRDNAPFRSDEQEAWFMMLARLQQSSYEQQASQSIGTVGYASLTSLPDTYRGKLVTVVGIPRRVENVEPAKNDLGIEQLYRITIEPLGGEVWPITIYLLNDPQLTIQNQTTPLTISTTGYFFKNQSYRWANGVGSMPILVAKEISQSVSPNRAKVSADSPKESEADFQIADSLLSEDNSLGRALLSDLGVDLDSYKEIKDQRPFTANETEAFYATLNAVKKTPARQLARLAEGGLASYAARLGFDPSEDNNAPTDRQMIMRRLITKEAKRGSYSAPILFGNASEQRGELVAFDGIVRRVVRIEVPNRAIGHYYELELFPEDSQNLPLVFCVTDLPTGFPVGESLRQPARLVGFFFKQWAYRSRNRANHQGSDKDSQQAILAGIDSRRFAPLLIGRAPLVLATPDAAAYRPGWEIGVIGTGLLAAMLVGIGTFRHLDKKYEQRITTKLRQTSSGDFSHLP